MKTFILRVLGTLILTAFFLEILLRIFQLAGTTMPEENLGGNRMLKPGAEGTWVRGGIGEIRSHYFINPQGWNSLLDYDVEVSNSTRVAIIGDSYIQGLHVDVENSIGRLLESFSENYLVHEYGRDGANMQDYILVYEEWVRDQYDHVFVMVSKRNLNAGASTYMNLGHKIPPNSIVRKIYGFSHLARYLNINHGMLAKVQSLFSGNIGLTKTANAASIPPADQNPPDPGAETWYSNFDSSVVFLYQDNTLDPAAMGSHKALQIDHQILPISSGFDKHWNVNGRLNCANTIHGYIQSNGIP